MCAIKESNIKWKVTFQIKNITKVEHHQGLQKEKKETV